MLLKGLNFDLEEKLKLSELKTNKLSDQIETMNGKFEEWKSKYDVLNARFTEMDQIESKIKSKRKFFVLRKNKILNLEVNLKN